MLIRPPFLVRLLIRPPFVGTVEFTHINLQNRNETGLQDSPTGSAPIVFVHSPVLFSQVSPCLERGLYRPVGTQILADLSLWDHYAHKFPFLYTRGVGGVTGGKAFQNTVKSTQSIGIIWLCTLYFPVISDSRVCLNLVLPEFELAAMFSTISSDLSLAAYHS